MVPCCCYRKGRSRGKIRHQELGFLFLLLLPKRQQEEWENCQCLPPAPSLTSCKLALYFPLQQELLLRVWFSYHSNTAALPNKSILTLSAPVTCSAGPLCRLCLPRVISEDSLLVQTRSHFPRNAPTVI